MLEIPLEEIASILLQQWHCAPCSSVLLLEVLEVHAGDTVAHCIVIEAFFLLSALSGGDWVVHK